MTHHKFGGVDNWVDRLGQQGDSRGSTITASVGEAYDEIMRGLHRVAELTGKAPKWYCPGTSWADAVGVAIAQQTKPARLLQHRSRRQGHRQQGRDRRQPEECPTLGAISQDVAQLPLEGTPQWGLQAPQLDAPRVAQVSFDADAGWGRCRIAWPSVQPMYTAAVRWRDAALIGDDSLFDGRRLDTRLATDELVELYVDSPDFGSGSFVSKLKGQLAQASDDAVQVAAELLYVHTLVASTTTWSARKKAELVNTVTAIGGPGVAPMPDDLAAVLAGGAAGTGQAYLNYRPRMFTYLVMVFRTIKLLPPAERREAVSSLQAWRSAVVEVDTQSVWSQEYALEHLLFPDVAPPILSRTDRASIVAAFPEAGADIETVCSALEPNVTYGRRSFVDPYWFPLRQRWNPQPAETLYTAWATQVAAAFDLDERERNYKINRQPLFAAALEAARHGGDPHAELKAALSGFNVVRWQVTDSFLTWVKAYPQTAAKGLTELQTDPGPESIDRFLALLPWESLSGMGARLSLASTLLLGCAAESLPPWRDTASRTTQRLTGGYACEAAATAGEIYLTFLERLDMILHTVNAQSGAAVLRDRLDAQGLAFTVATRTSTRPDGSPPRRKRSPAGRTAPPPPRHLTPHQHQSLRRRQIATTFRTPRSCHSRRSPSSCISMISASRGWRRPSPCSAASASWFFRGHLGRERPTWPERWRSSWPGVLSESRPCSSIPAPATRTSSKDCGPTLLTRPASPSSTGR